MVDGRRMAVGLVAALLMGGCTSSEPTEPLFGEQPSEEVTVSESPAKPIPDSIPASAFLAASDAPGKAHEKPRRLGSGDQPLPAFCGASYEQKSQIGVRGTQLLLISSADAPDGSTPKAAVYEEVIVFEGDGATAFMTALRKAVTGCATQKDDKNYLRGPVEGGDDSELIERTSPATDDAGEPVEGQLHHLFWAAVRQGDTVAFVSNTGWESGSAEKSDTVTLASRAAARIKAWRG
jgi:hypothetical protein